ncbi:MAG: hypothetical protein IJ230_02430, partial [Clostridia bacterium]|nr:hypothetical protein [Clostridia bacterium]
QVVTQVFRAFLDAYVLAVRDVGMSKYYAEINELRTADNFQEAVYTLMNRAMSAWRGRNS